MSVIVLTRGRVAEGDREAHWDEGSPARSRLDLEGEKR